MLLVNAELKEAQLGKFLVINFFFSFLLIIITKDTHAVYLEGLRSLTELRKKTIEDGQLFKEYQNQLTDKQFELEIYQAEEEYTVSCLFAVIGKSAVVTGTG